jgi:hypothetical protein
MTNGGADDHDYQLSPTPLILKPQHNPLIAM